MRPLATLSNSVSLFCDGSCARSLELPYADASVACSLVPSGKGADCTERSGLLFAGGEEAGGVSGMGQGAGYSRAGRARTAPSTAACCLQGAGGAGGGEWDETGDGGQALRAGCRGHRL